MCKLHRRDEKAKGLTNLCRILRRKRFLTEDMKRDLKRRFNDFNFEIIENEHKNDNWAKTKRQYSEKIKEFTSTLYFYSTKAYNYIRNKIKLPCVSILRKMISGYACKAGFVNGIFNFLRNEYVKSDFVRNVAVIVNGMSIHSQVLVDNKDSYTSWLH